MFLKSLFALIAFLAFAPFADAAMNCTRTSPSSQDCTQIVNWPPAPVDSSHDPATGYIVQRQDAGGAFIEVARTDQLTYVDQFSDSGNVQHCYQVIAFNAGGNSLPNQPSCGVSPVIPVFAPNSPGPTQLAALSGSEVLVTIADRSDNETGFQIERKGGGQGNVLLETDVAQFVDSGLRPRSRYDYRVRAVGDGGTSDWNRWARVRTLR